MRLVCGVVHISHTHHRSNLHQLGPLILLDVAEIGSPRQFDGGAEALQRVGRGGAAVDTEGVLMSSVHVTEVASTGVCSVCSDSKSQSRVARMLLSVDSTPSPKDSLESNRIPVWCQSLPHKAQTVDSHPTDGNKAK